MENSRGEIRGERTESEEDINDIKNKIKKSLEENNKESISEVSNLGKTAIQKIINPKGVRRASTSPVKEDLQKRSDWLKKLLKNWKMITAWEHSIL